MRGKATFSTMSNFFLAQEGGGVDASPLIETKEHSPQAYMHPFLYLQESSEQALIKLAAFLGYQIQTEKQNSARRKELEEELEKVRAILDNPI